MTCNRAGCENVNCVRLSFGYICRKCFDKLTAAGVGTDVVAFMGRRQSYNFQRTKLSEVVDE